MTNNYVIKSPSGGYLSYKGCLTDNLRNAISFKTFEEASQALSDRASPPFYIHPIPASPEMNTIDPWQHRSENMRCKSCMWFAPKEGKDGVTNLGRCRRHAPTMNGFPVVYVNDWCGDHKLNENWPND